MNHENCVSMTLWRQTQDQLEVRTGENMRLRAQVEAVREAWAVVERDKRDACRMTMDDPCEGCDCGYDRFIAALGEEEG